MEDPSTCSKPIGHALPVVKRNEHDLDASPLSSKEKGTLKVIPYFGSMSLQIQKTCECSHGI